MNERQRTGSSVGTDGQLRDRCIGQTGSQPGEMGDLFPVGGAGDEQPMLYIPRLYKATQETVHEGIGQDALAADMGMSRQLLNLRLNRKQNSNGEIQRLHFDTLGWIFCDAQMKWNWLTKINIIAGAQPPQPVREPTLLEKFRALAAEMNEKQRRRIEREQGWAPGTLDR